MKHIVSFSGGKDSTAMLLLMIEKKMPIDEIIFCDTGKEFPVMYEHINKVEKYINRKITIIRSEKSFEYYLGKYQVKNKMSKNYNKMGLGWGNHIFRWCTGYLKIIPLRIYFKKYKGIQFKEYIGFAYDEQHRSGKNNNGRNLSYPLIDWKITEKQALKYCYSKGFDWNGLYNKFLRVSCYCCPLQRLGELYIIWKDFPELWADMQKMDKMSHRQFRADYSLSELEIKFKYKQKQTTLEFL